MKIPKVLAVMNGWSLAPHCWRRFLTHPIEVQDARPYQFSITILGFAIFFDTSAARTDGYKIKGE